jgi:hypothetical protein
MILTTRFVPYSAMAIYPFILVKRKEFSENAVLINHERIHHRQQLELLIIPFYLIYLLNYLFNFIRYRNHYRAYKEIIFEREAFAQDADLDYLNKRKLYSFLKFIY